MTTRRSLVIYASLWAVAISVLHASLNVNWAAVLNDYKPLSRRKITVAYIPVTCQLTCPVTDYISKVSDKGEIFMPRMFQGFPEIKEALISNRVQAAFIVAPLAIALKSQGVPIKVVYLGHRYGSALVVRKDGAGEDVCRPAWKDDRHSKPLLRRTSYGLSCDESVESEAH